jgi:hypothetical protein
MPTKASIAKRMVVRRGLDETDSAVYLSLSPSFFCKVRTKGLMPRPRVVRCRRSIAYAKGSTTDLRASTSARVGLRPRVVTP